MNIVNQKIQIGKAHAHKTVTVVVEADLFHITVDDDLHLQVARTNRNPVRRFKMSADEATPRTRHPTQP